MKKLMKQIFLCMIWFHIILIFVQNNMIIATYNEEIMPGVIINSDLNNNVPVVNNINKSSKKQSNSYFPQSWNFNFGTVKKK